jgi:hypothetical protein
VKNRYNVCFFTCNLYRYNEFERAFGAASSQRDVYSHVQPIVRQGL